MLRAQNEGTEDALEGRLRNLIISNNPLGQDQMRGNTSAVQPGIQPGLRPAASIVPGGPSGSRDTSSNNDAAVDIPVTHYSQQSKPSRRRPNQAQRRQMNSQLSIPIDPRPQPVLQQRPYYSPPGHPARPPGPPGPPGPPFQRHGYSNSHPSQFPPGGHPGFPRPHGHWGHHMQRGGGHHGHGPQSPPHHHPHHGHHHQRDPSDFSNGPMSPQSPRGGPQNRFARPFNQKDLGDITASAAVLDQMCFNVIMQSEIDVSEIAEKEAFRCKIEAISREAIIKYELEQSPSQDFPPYSVELKCFGSLSSGFATKASDMDLGLISPFSKIQPDAPGSPIPRILEKALLDAGLGARLLTRTRVPIIKLCENPPDALRQELLAERYKWESGLENETHDAHEEDDLEQIPQSPEDGAGAGNAAVEEHESRTIIELPVPSQKTGEGQRFQLKQGAKSLVAYYAVAKRILRRLGGRDVTMSNYQEFTDEDWAVLTRVCEAFWFGLADVSLRKHLEQYPSLAFERDPSIFKHRSLLGIFQQIEGEQLWYLWEKRGEVTETTPSQGALADRVWTIWEQTQLTNNFKNDPMAFAKEIQFALEKVKKLPTVQLLSLEQAQFEPPAQYFARFFVLANQLKGNEVKLSIPKQEAIMKLYVAGIHKDEIRLSMQEFVANTKPQSLKALARRHKCLHLAWEYERALEKDLYEPSTVEDVKSYITLLRSETEISNDESVVPVSATNAALVARIASLADPRKMAPNQPRDRYRDRLEFPKTGAGVQCDINFSAHLALQNTLLLRCYSHSDPRVRPMVLFVKHWAKTRGINSGYRGTLSSYGYVLMVLHYLVNVAQPFVCPNLQKLAPPPPPNMSTAEYESTVNCKGYDIQFWRDERAIVELARAGQLNGNTHTVGHLLRGFFEYYAHNGPQHTYPGNGFDWGRDVLSLRTQGGLISKREKGWTGAKTVFEVQEAVPSKPQDTTASPVISKSGTGEDKGPAPESAPSPAKPDVKEVRHRYLFAIEDPFELDHNVARTVTHNGIVAIRDEFRRAWRLIKIMGTAPLQEDFLQDATGGEGGNFNSFHKLLEDIHGMHLGHVHKLSH